VTVKVPTPNAEGVPLMMPVEALKFSPPGSAPLVIAQLIGAVPVTAMLCRYGVPTRAAGNGDVVMIDGGPLTVRLSCLELQPNALVALTVKVATPSSVDVPLMAPVNVFKIRPAGSAPAVAAQVVGPLPEAVRACQYGTPACVGGKGEAVLIDGGVRGSPWEKTGRERANKVSKNLATRSEAC